MTAQRAFGRRRTQRSFETLYREHVADIYRYAVAATGNTSDAEDVTQTTFMNAYRAYSRGERPLKPQNWLLSIAHNVCRQRSRQSAHRPYEVEFVDEVAETLVRADDVPSADDIKRALARLPYAQRATLIMLELEGRSHAEIAEILGLTAAATEMLAFRARRAFREHLAGSLTCTQAEAALERQLDGAPSDDDEAGLLRAHLRECPECERLARRLRAQRTAWRALAVVPLPASLRSFGPGAAATTAAGVGSGVAVKAAVVTLAAATAGGGVYAAKQSVAASRPHVRPPATHVSSTVHAPVRRAATTVVEQPAPTQPTQSTQSVARTSTPRVTEQPPAPAPTHGAATAHANHGVRRRAHGAPSRRGVHGRSVKTP